jgi:hypothetical protein
MFARVCSKKTNGEVYFAQLKRQCHCQVFVIGQTAAAAAANEMQHRKRITVAVFSYLKSVSAEGIITRAPLSY